MVVVIVQQRYFVCFGKSKYKIWYRIGDFEEWTPPLQATEYPPPGFLLLNIASSRGLYPWRNKFAYSVKYIYSHIQNTIYMESENGISIYCSVPCWTVTGCDFAWILQAINLLQKTLSLKSALKLIPKCIVSNCDAQASKMVTDK